MDVPSWFSKEGLNPTAPPFVPREDELTRYKRRRARRRTRRRNRGTRGGTNKWLDPKVKESLVQSKFTIRNGLLHSSQGESSPLPKPGRKVKLNKEFEVSGVFEVRSIEMNGGYPYITLHVPEITPSIYAFALDAFHRSYQLSWWDVVM